MDTMRDWIGPLVEFSLRTVTEKGIEKAQSSPFGRVQLAYEDDESNIRVSVNAKKSVQVIEVRILDP